MKARLLSALVLTIGIYLGCVSVKIGAEGDKRKTNQMVRYSAPTTPFTALDSATADKAWQNSINGNSIGYQSICDHDQNGDLENIQKELESEFHDVKVINRGRKEFNQRDALVSVVEGKIDGVPTRLKSVVFRKNGCSYTITYLAVARSFDSDLKAFEKFLSDFVVP